MGGCGFNSRSCNLTDKKKIQLSSLDSFRVQYIKANTWEDFVELFSCLRGMRVKECLYEGS